MKPPARPTLSRRSRRIVKRALAIVEESRGRMDTYTPAQRAELEREARARIAAGGGHK